MDDTRPTDEDLTHLRHAAEYRYSGLDLRFEGGPWLGALDKLVDRGLLTFEVRGPDYMVGYMLTEAGRAALG